MNYEILYHESAMNHLPYQEHFNDILKLCLTLLGLGPAAEMGHNLSGETTLKLKTTYNLGGYITEAKEKEQDQDEMKYAPQDNCQTSKTCLGTSGFVASRSEGNVERSRAARQHFPSQAIK